MVQLNTGYTLILRARNEAGQAVRMMEIGMLDDAAKAVKHQSGSRRGPENVKRRD